MSDRETLISQRFDPANMAQWTNRKPDDFIAAILSEVKREELLIQEWAEILLRDQALSETTVTDADGLSVPAGELINYILTSARIIKRLNQVTEAYLRR